jgi:hypothetical protein
MSRYKWVRHEGGKLYEIGILSDGTLHNPNGYPDDVVRAAVSAADARRHERRSRAAQKAAETRRFRQRMRFNDVVKYLLANNRLGPSRHCFMCGRHLTDPESISRGIGSECWGSVQSKIEGALTQTREREPA